MKNTIDFLVVGTAKAATTSLYYYLKQHPSICIPTKETFFFMSEFYNTIGEDDPSKRDKKDIVYDFKQYQEIMRSCPKSKIVGEIGTGYLYQHKTAIPKIKKFIGDPKIIIILRNPIERAYSNYMHMVRNGREQLSFQECIDLEQERLDKNWDFMWQFTNLGFYSHQVKEYLENFSDVLVLFYEDIEKDPSVETSKIINFLNLENFPIKTDTKYNISGKLKDNLIVNSLLKKNPIRDIFLPMYKFIFSKDTRFLIRNYIRSKNLKKKDELDRELRASLSSLYQDDIRKLEKILNKSLAWN